MRRENRQDIPHYDEMCRRYLADEADYAEDRLREAGITQRFDNNGTIEETIEALSSYIRASRGGEDGSHPAALTASVEED